MRTDILWAGDRRAARMHWWRQVMDRPATVNWNDLLDEAASQRFSLGEDADAWGDGSCRESCPA